MQHRSLGAILGRLDREEGVDWLTGRGQVQKALAGVLGIPKGSLLAGLRPRSASRSERWVTFSAMPLARGLDLVEEDLFPGIPEAVLHPGRWDRLIWVAPSGSGRSLTGQWLAARGLAEHRTRASDDSSELPKARPLLLELGSARALTPEVVAPGVCVAVPEPWEPPVGFGACVVVRSPPIGELIEPLVRWACARFAESAQLAPERLAQRLHALVAHGVVTSAGDVLGLVGLADAEGLEALDEPSLERSARSWLRRRARERLDPEAPELGWMRREGFDTLVSLARTVTTDAEDPLFCPRSIEAWSELLPEGTRHGPDLEWLKVALPQADPSVRLATLERATEKLPPGAFRVLRCFEQLGVLARDGDELLAPRPHWLVRAAEGVALERLVTGAAFDWGDALLSPRMATRTMERLVKSARERALPLDELVEPAASRDPGYAAAIEGAVRALGAAELSGVDADGEALEPLWNEQLRLTVALPDGTLHPRIEHAPAAGAEGAFWLTRGAWYLALLALGEALDGHQGRRDPLLRPWLSTEPPPGVSEMLDAVALSLERPDAPAEILGPAVGLVSRLGALLGPLGSGRSRHRLERAATVADEAAVGVLNWSSIAALAGDRLACVGLAHLVRERRLEAGLLGRQVFQAFEAAGMPGAEAGALFEPELAPLVLPSAPISALPALLAPLVRLAELPELSPSQWHALLAVDLRAVPAAFFGHVPETLLDAAIDAACRAEHRAGIAVLWTRSSAAMTEALLRMLLAADATGTRGLLLDTAPPSVTPGVLVRLPDAPTLLKGPSQSLDAVRRFLHARVTERGPGFRDAYALFADLEGHLEAVHARS